MSWTPAILVPLAVQAMAMGFDELHFHRIRGLGRWERLGHPLDTLTMLACVGWALVTQPTSRNIAIYVALSAASCLFITKDEFVHARRCTPAEQWIHALLFVMHPLTLLSLGLLWLSLEHAQALFGHRVLASEFAATLGFCVYQALYWNTPWIRRATAAR